MGLRFRRRLQLFPGLTLNFSGSGISATLGVPGANINIGKHGVNGTAGIPGTGVHYRTNLMSFGDVDAGSSNNNPISDYAPTMYAIHPNAVEIKSSNDDMTSINLLPLKQMIIEAREQTEDAKSNLLFLEKNLSSTKRSILIRKILSFGYFFKSSLATLEQQQNDLIADISTTNKIAQLGLIELNTISNEKFDELWQSFSAAFDHAKNSDCIWDVTTSASLNSYERSARRTSANEEISRSKVRFTNSDSPIFKSTFEMPVFKNNNGSDIVAHPGFLYMRLSNGDFSLIDLNDVQMTCKPSRFIENESVPSDANIVSYVWEKANKDGSPDRRFSQNRQIPVCQYAELSLKTNSGLFEIYQVSNYSAAEALVSKFDQLKSVLKNKISLSTQQQLTSA